MAATATASPRASYIVISSSSPISQAADEGTGSIDQMRKYASKFKFVGSRTGGSPSPPRPMRPSASPPSFKIRPQPQAGENRQNISPSRPRFILPSRSSSQNSDPFEDLNGSGFKDVSNQTLKSVDKSGGVATSTETHEQNRQAEPTSVLGSVPRKNIVAEQLLELQGPFGYNDQKAPYKISPNLLENRSPVQHKKSKVLSESCMNLRKPAVSGIRALKPPTKSTRTITGAAVATSLAQNHEASPSKVDFESQHASARVSSLIIDGAEPTSAIAPVFEPSSKKRASTSSTKSKKRPKTVEAKHKLLSPETAQRKFYNQEIVFGSSSQIAREDPRELIDLTRAIQESESMQTTTDSISGGNPSKSLTSTRDLWSAAIRDEKDALFEQCAWPFPSSQSRSLRCSAFEDKTSTDRKRVDADGLAMETLRHTQRQSGVKSRPKSKPLLCASSAARAFSTKAARNEEPNEIQTRPSVNTDPAPSDEKLQSISSVKTAKKSRERYKESAKALKDAKPTDPGLAGSKNAPKSRKRRKAGDESNEKAQAPNANEWHDIEAMNEQNDSAKAMQEMSVPAIDDARIDANAQDPVNKNQVLVERHEILSPQITTAIRNSRAADDTTLETCSWYEKILLYKPIVIEDLTDWLNDSGVLQGWNADLSHRKEFKSERVNPQSVQQWCEARSICCVWRKDNVEQANTVGRRKRAAQN